MLYTRRELGKIVLAAVPCTRVLKAGPAFAFQTRPGSKVNGVMIGMNVPYSFGGRSAPVEEIIGNCLQLGISGVELRTQPVEAALGVPAHLVLAGRGEGGRGRGAAAPAGTAAGQAAGETAGGRGRRGAGEDRGAPAPLTPEQDRVRKATADELRRWRTSVSMDRVREIRNRFTDAGILIEIVKVDNIITMGDDEIDYQFNLAKNLGARAISTEIALDGTRRLGGFADKHKMMVGYHGHASTGPKDFETAFSQATFNGANLDIGHFVAGQNTSPIPFIKQHHARITHIHVKDRKMHDGANVPFGQGDTPIEETLQLIRDNKWNIQATIEFEYPLPAGSDRMTELKRCVDFCRAALA